MLWGCGVVEFEAVRTIVHADCVYEGLVYVVEEGEGGGWDGEGGLAMAETAEGWNVS